MIADNDSLLPDILFPFPFWLLQKPHLNYSYRYNESTYVINVVNNVFCSKSNQV